MRLCDPGVDGDGDRGKVVTAMKVGYARVSTEDQSLDLQRDALRHEGCVRVIEEKRSGASTQRPALRGAMRSLRAGDVLVVWKLDRLGRSLQHLISILEDLERRGIGFRSISDNINTTSAVGKLVYHIVGAMAEFERALISERTKAGMEAARKRGKTLGRPRRMNAEQVECARQMAASRTMSLGAIAEMLSVGRTTVWRALSPSGKASRLEGSDKPEEMESKVTF